MGWGSPLNLPTTSYSPVLQWKHTTQPGLRLSVEPDKVSESAREFPKPKEFGMLRTAITTQKKKRLSVRSPEQARETVVGETGMVGSVGKAENKSGSVLWHGTTAHPH